MWSMHGITMSQVEWETKWFWKLNSKRCNTDVGPGEVNHDTRDQSLFLVSINELI